MKLSQVLENQQMEWERMNGAWITWVEKKN